LRRGEIVAIAAPGDYGKPRPAVIIQADILNEMNPGGVIVALMTSTLRDAPLLRLTVDPTGENGLKKPSQVMVDKLVTIRRAKIGQTAGSLTNQQLLVLDRLLALVIGLA
jgi:mRNA interferase MazF